MEIVNQLEELERTGKKEHVVFLVTQRPAVAARSSVGSSKAGAFPRAQSLQPLAGQHNAMIWIKEVKLMICVTTRPEVTYPRVDKIIQNEKHDMTDHS